jgi:hypothetical protein
MFRVKKRIVSKDLRGLIHNGSILNPLRAGPVAIALWSHKLLRWLVAYFLCGMFVANVLHLHSTFFRITLAAQALFYAVALISTQIKQEDVKLPWSVVLSFCLVNCAAMLGVLDYVANRSFGQWKPVR